MKTQAEILNENVIELDGRVTQLDQKVNSLEGSVNTAISAVADQANSKVEALGEAMNTAISTVIEKTDSLTEDLSATVDRIREIDETVAGMNQSGESGNSESIISTLTDWDVDKIYNSVIDSRDEINSNISLRANRLNDKINNLFNGTDIEDTEFYINHLNSLNNLSSMTDKFNYIDSLMNV